MIIQKLESQLSSRYEILGTIYLSRFFDVDGKNYLYQSLKSLYKENYTPNQKILVFQDCNDVYDYDDLPGQSISTLQKYLWEIDISNCFVMVVTTNPAIAQELDQAKTLYSEDESTIEYFLAPGDYVKQHNITDAFCVLPWMHIYAGPHGDVLPCCFGDKQFPLGNLNKSSVKEIIQSEKFTDLRADMLAGRRVKECSWCWNLEDQGIISQRQKSNLYWSSTALPITTDGRLHKVEPKSMDIRLSNLCNLKCRMCDSYYSSAIAQEAYDLFGKNIESLTKAARQETINEIIALLPHMEVIYFAGGEPLMSAEHYAILDGFLTCGNLSVDISYNTNFSLLKYKNRSVIDLWNRFPNVTVHASLDGTHREAEYIRHGTDWSKIQQNLDVIKSSTPHVKVDVESTLGFMNVESLIKLQKTWHEDGRLSIAKFSINVMTSPSYLTLCVLPAHHKQRLAILIDQHISWCQAEKATTLADQWRAARDFMWSRDDSYLLPKFQKITMQLDRYRSESFESVFPQYKDLCDWLN